MTNFIDPWKATQIKYEPSSSTSTHVLQLITMQKGRLCCHIVINNFIVFQMQYVNMGISHEQIIKKKKCFFMFNEFHVVYKSAKTIVFFYLTSMSRCIKHRALRHGFYGI